MVKNQSTSRTKLDPRFEISFISERVGPHQYRLEGKPGKFDIEHLVPVSATTPEVIVDEDCCPPLPREEVEEERSGL